MNRKSSILSCEDAPGLQNPLRASSGRSGVSIGGGSNEKRFGRSPVHRPNHRPLRTWLRGPVLRRGAGADVDLRSSAGLLLVRPRTIDQIRRGHSLAAAHSQDGPFTFNLPPGDRGKIGSRPAGRSRYQPRFEIAGPRRKPSILGLALPTKRLVFAASEGSQW